MHVPKAPGFASMLKEGAKHYAGLEEAVYRNISACMQLSKSTRSAFGPNGMNKMDGSGVATVDAMQKGILDLFLVKLWGLKFATNAASTVLKVDEIIMAKPAGGPKPQKKAGWDEDPDE